MTRMLGCGTQRELDLGHYPSTYCKALGGIAVVRMLLHVLADSLCFYRKCWMCTFNDAVMWDIDMGLNKQEV